MSRASDALVRIIDARSKLLFSATPRRTAWPMSSRTEVGEFRASWIALRRNSGERKTALSASPPPIAKSDKLVLRASDFRWAVLTAWNASIPLSTVLVVWRRGGRGAAFTKPSAVNSSWPTFPK